jgi:uncharacterized iron-regulated membrane protein
MRPWARPWGQRLQPSRRSTPFRKALFWLHLAAGLAAGTVIFIMAVTGVLLAYERQITEWSERGLHAAPPSPGAPRLPAEALLAAAAGVPGVSPTSLTVQSDPAAPASVSLGRERTVYVNPYTGALLGEGSPKTRAFFRKVTDVHRWLGVSGERRGLARGITGACNLGFLILVLSGPFLWLPGRWTRSQVRNVAWFRRGLGGKARDFNWHNVIGLWTAAPLLLIVTTGVVMSYPWANSLLFRAVGEEPPARPGPERGPERERGGEAPSLDGLDALWARAEGQVPGWQSIALRLPGSAEAPVVFTIARGQRGRPDLRAQLTLDRRSGAVVKWEPFAGQSPGRRLRSWGRFTHTGEAGGLAGQTLAGLASAGAAVLVWTGFALAWRRLFARRPARQVHESEAESGTTPDLLGENV